MGTQYSHLSEADRVLIEVALRQGYSQAAIARQLGTDRSTISRELKRGSRGGEHVYMAVLGQRTYDMRRRSAGLARRKLDLGMRRAAWQPVLAGLRAGFSPQQVAGRLRSVDPLFEISKPPLYVSHETIYCAIYAMPRGTLRAELVSLLRRSRAGRLPRSRGKSRSTGLQDATPIALRPPEVAARIVPGHWEGDLLKGAGNRSAVGTLVERTSRYVMLARLDGCNATNVLDGFTRRLLDVPPSLRRTLTYDRGSEMALHQHLARRLRIDIYFCDPYKPWQRGSNENANGLIREYLPKGMDLSRVTEQQLADIEYLLNNRPRRILGYRTPQEVFDELRADQIAGVALAA